MSNALSKTTYTTKKQLDAQEIVLPGDYSKVFESNAKIFGLDLEDEEILLEDLHFEEKRITRIVNDTSNHLNVLSTGAKDAQTAIINKDTNALNKIENQMSEMQEEIEYLQNELFSDELTKAKNRRWFSSHYLIKNKCPDDGCLAFIDLNDFKRINDNYGHILGDQVLKYLANFLKEALPFDWAHTIRYAGDEFLVIFDKAFQDTDALTTKMDNVQKTLSKRVLKSKNVKNLQFSFSYGLALFKKDDDFDDIITIADELMYENKKKIKGLK